MAFLRLFFLPAVVLSVISEVQSLTCYRTDPMTHELEEVENDEFVFCSLFPAHISQKTGKFEHAVADGVIEEEIKEEKKPFDKMFETEDTSHGYEILSLCIHEKYDFSKMFKQAGYSPKFHKIPGVEYQFRCLCNTDRCNDPEKLKPYLNTPEQE